VKNFMTSVIQTQRLGKVALIEMNRPDALNALNKDARTMLAAELEAVARDNEIGAVVLAGAGRAFCAGADLKGDGSAVNTGLLHGARVLQHDFHPLLEYIVKMDKPVIAAVNGAAAGVGMSLVLACDLVVMADNAYLHSNFVNIGLIPDGGIAWLLQRRIGYGRSFEVLADTQKMDAQQCLNLGVANRVVTPESLRDTALEWAARLADRAPIAMALTKRLARVSQTSSLADALAIEVEMQAFCASTEDAREAMSAFVKKQKPTFKGR
jgi:2-(1,2-epoxy-1,2-dihydrophenyl)acetyl-CoA isomerase